MPKRRRIKVIGTRNSRIAARATAKRYGARYKKFGPGNYLVYKIGKKR